MTLSERRPGHRQLNDFHFVLFIEAVIKLSVSPLSIACIVGYGLNGVRYDHTSLAKLPRLHNTVQFVASVFI